MRVADQVSLLSWVAYQGRVRVEQGVDSGDARCGGRAPAVTLDMAQVVCVEKQVTRADE